LSQFYFIIFQKPKCNFYQNKSQLDWALYSMKSVIQVQWWELMPNFQQLQLILKAYFQGKFNQQYSQFIRSFDCNDSIEIYV